MRVTAALGFGRAADRAIFDVVKLVRLDDREREAVGRFVRGSAHLLHDEDGNTHTRGGSWNMASDSMAYGFTKDDVAALKRRLRELKVRLSDDEAFAALCQARFALENPSRYADTMSSDEAKREAWRQKRAERIARLRSAGLCIICGKNPTVGPERSTCYYCGVKANAAKRKG